MLKVRTWKRVAAGLAAMALTAVSAGVSLTGSAVSIEMPAQTEAISAENSTAGADTIAAGSWEFTDISTDCVEASDKAALEAALEGTIGVSYEPKDVIAVQTVAGRNLAFLCKATPATLNAESYWAIISVYVDVQGKATLNTISTVDPAAMKVIENAEEPAPGSWVSEAKKNAADIPESVQKAVGNVKGVNYAPIAVLGTQIVAGKNYCILAYGTTATATPMTNLYVLYVYEKLDGTSEVVTISALDLPAYVTPAETAADLADCTVNVDSTTGAVTVMIGDKKVEDTEYSVLYEGLDNNFRGTDYPRHSGSYKATITAKENSNVISGTIKKEFTLTTDLSDCTVDINSTTGTVTVKYGDKEISDAEYRITYEGIDVDYIGTDKPTSSGRYNVTVTAKENSKVISGAVKKEFTLEAVGNIIAGWEFSDISTDSVEASEKAMLEAALQETIGVTYEAKDVIASQTVAGKNLAFLCKATPATLNAKSYWAIVSVYVDLQGKATLNTISTLDPADMKLRKSADEPSSGSWTSETKEKTAVLPESVQKAVSTMTGVTYSPIAVLGTQFVSGKNYCILAYGRTATANPVTNLYVLTVYENPDGASKVNTISALDLAAYVTPEKKYFASAEELGNMAKIDYEKKTGIACYIEESVLNADGTEVTVKLTNADGKLLETYTIDPYTGEGRSASGEAVNLPQTGNTSPLAVAAASGAAFLVLTGVFTAIKSGLVRKKKVE